MHRDLSSRIAVGAVACAAGLFTAGSAQAGYTWLNEPSGGEASHLEILNHIYGTSFSQSGLDFTDGTIIAKRVQDTQESNGVMDTVGGDPDGASDQYWTGGIISASVEAKFASYAQSFGYYEGKTGGAFNKLFDVVGSGFGVSGSASNIDLSDLIYRWARGGDGDQHTSRNWDNVDLSDHMVTYQIQNLDDGMTTWLLFWEDLNCGCAGGPKSDEDFNDLVIEIKALAATPVPLPAAAWTGLATLAGGGLVRRFRRKA